MCKLWCPYEGRGAGVSLSELPVLKQNLAFCPANHHPEAYVLAGCPDHSCYVQSLPTFRKGNDF